MNKKVALVQQLIVERDPNEINSIKFVILPTLAMKLVSLFLIALIISNGCVQSGDTLPQPNPNGVVEKAWAYCGQFSNQDCNVQSFTDSRLAAPVSCNWNETSNKCQAGIAYQ